MPQFFEWIMSNLFIVVIIAGALLSVFSKKNAKPNGGGEPFGGRGANPQRQGNAPRQTQNSEEQRRSPFAGAPEHSDRNARDRGGMQAEQTDLDQASRQLNAEIDKRLRDQRSMQNRSQRAPKDPRKNERSSATASNHAVTKSKSLVNEPANMSAASVFDQPTANELRKGVLWAEVLGAPRAKKPYSSGRR